MTVMTTYMLEYNGFVGLMEACGAHGGCLGPILQRGQLFVRDVRGERQSMVLPSEVLVDS